MAFPTDVLTLAASIGSQYLNLAFGGSVAMSTGLNLMLADLKAGLTKLGTGASTATANTVLRGTGSGTTAFGAIVNADIDAAAAIAFSKTAAGASGSLLTSNGSTNSMSTTPSIAGLLTLTGGQIAFPATQVPSTDANTLDDYEEGTFTPSLGGTSSLGTATGTYIKVGRIVHAWGIIAVNTIGSGSTTAISTSGLPSADQVISGSVSRVSSAAANAVTWTCYINGSTITIDAKNATNGAASSDALAVFGNSTQINFAVTYRTAA